MKRFQNIRIGQKIIGGFLALVLLFTINAVVSILTLNRSDDIIQESSAVINPSRELLNEMNLQVIKSKMYITNWVYLQSNSEDKQALRNLHETEYPALKEKLTVVIGLWKDKRQVAQMDSILLTFDQLLKVQKGIMSKLVSFENYEDPEIKFEAANAIDTDVLGQSAWLISRIDRLLAQKITETRRAETNLVASFTAIRVSTIGISLVLILVGLAAAFLVTRSITRPINYVKDIVQQMARGELPQEQQNQYHRDEVGEMAQAVETLVSSLRATSLFAESIGKGNYQSDYVPLSQQDVLGTALVDMRDNLQRVAEDDQKRNWATEGMALFGEILRKNNTDLARLADEIISNLVKYLRANQGGLYIVQDDVAGEEPHLTLAACYAWDKKKYLEQKIYAGEGLTGQAWEERQYIYLTEVPDQYVSITSGLGEANPRSLLIVPLQINEVVYGVVEMASFGEFAEHERAFVERIAESIASTISTVRINQRTRRLLDESTQMTEQMRSQEEEMRQNMEELQATQEEMMRTQRDAQAREEVLFQTQCILETDVRFNISFANALLQTHLHYIPGELFGTAVARLFAEEATLSPIAQALEAGRSWSGTARLKNQAGQPRLFKVSASPVTDEAQKVVKYMLLLDDLSEISLG